MNDFIPTLAPISSFRQQLTDFVEGSNVLGTMTGVSIGLAFKQAVWAFVNEIVFPLLYTLTKFKIGKDGREFSPISKEHFSRFAKELIVFILVLIMTYLFIQYFVKNLLNIKKVAPPAKPKTKGNGSSAAIVDDGGGGEGFELYKRRY